jgi:hypothetical protein
LPANASTTNDTTPFFDWNAAANASDYQVLVDNNASFASPEKNFITARTDYTIGVPMAAGTYYWRVRGHNTTSGCNTWGPWSIARSLTISTCATPGTAGLVAPANGTTTGDSTPTFDWNPASDANEYRVQVDNNANFSSPEKNFVTMRTDYTLGVGLAPGTYYWRLRGHNTAGCDV